MKWFEITAWILCAMGLAQGYFGHEAAAYSMASAAFWLIVSRT